MKKGVSADKKDATNIARILIELGDQDVLIETNSRINQKKKWPWMGKPGEVNWEDWMSTLQPVNLGPKKPPVAEVIQEKEPIVVLEGKSTAEGLTGSPAQSEGTAVEVQLSALTIDGPAVNESVSVVEAVPVLGPPVGAKKEGVTE